MSSFRVDNREEGERLDRFLQQVTALSRKKVKGLLDQGRIFINGRKVIIASWQVRRGSEVEIRDEAPPHSPKAMEHFLKIIYEDSDLLVVDKDAGILCEPSPLATAPTIVEIINAYFKRKYPFLKTHYLGLVHRLDRETSGLMVYSKTREANRITDQFKKHTIKRKYLAVVEGTVKTEQGSVTGYLQKSDLLKGGKKVKSSTAASGQKAITQWRLIERYANASLLEVTLNTGRTHQIRVQMASVGHPVVGDKTYGKPTQKKINFSRQALHASCLAFVHPVTKAKMEFRSELPRDLRRLVDRLRVTS